MLHIDSGRECRVPVAVLCLIAVSTIGCLQNEGRPPPSGVFNFPIASATLTLNPADGPRFLFIANSNFDLRYNSATLQSFDLAVVNQSIDDLCTPVLPPPEYCVGPVPPECANAESPDCLTAEPAHAACALVPEGSGQDTLRGDGLLRICALPNLLVDEVRIGSFADGVEIGPDGTRLYLPVRGDADLTRIDINAMGQMDCGGGFGTTDACLASFRRTDRELAELRDLQLPTDPVAVYVGSLGDFPGHDASEGNYVVMGHRTGAASLFIDPPNGAEAMLVDVIDGLPTDLSPFTMEPETGLLWSPSANSLQIARIGVAIDETFAPGDVRDGFLFNAGSAVVRHVNAGGRPDLRQMAFDPRPTSRAAYIINRSPPALIIADRDIEVDGFLAPSILPDHFIRVGSGPARLGLAELPTSSGPRMFAFISCFGSRDIHVVDVDLARLVSVIRELSGPFEIEIDTVRNRLYAVDFRTSVVRVVDLAPMLDCMDGDREPSAECAPRLIGLIGVPEAVEELQ